MTRLGLVWCILVMGTCPPVQAADWVRVSTPGGDRHFYDRSKLLIEGDEVTYWRRVDFASPMRAGGGTARLALYRERIDCRQHTVRALAWQILAGEGALLESASATAAEAVAVVPDTVGDRFHSVMCALLGAQKQRDGELARIRADLAACRADLEAAGVALTAARAEAEALRAAGSVSCSAPAPTDSPEPPR